MTQFLHFRSVTATFRIWSPGKKNPYSQICVVPFSNFGNWITFSPLRTRCLFCIELHCSLTFTSLA